MKELDVKFTSMKSEMFGVAKTVDTIDWAAYGQTHRRTHTQTRRQLGAILGSRR